MKVAVVTNLCRIGESWKKVYELLGHDVDLIFFPRALNLLKYDLVHANTFAPAYCFHKNLIAFPTGSDARELQHQNSIEGKTLGWGYRRAKKILCATPDILSWLEHYQKVKPIFFPQPCDVNRFKPRTPRNDGKVRVAVVSRDDPVKHLHVFERAKPYFSSNVVVEYIRGVSFEDMPKVYERFDVVIDQFGLGVFGLTTLEALSSGCHVITHYNHEGWYSEEPPLINCATSKQIVQVLNGVANEFSGYPSFSELKKVNVRGVEWVKKFHSFETCLKQLKPIIDEVMKK